MNFGRRRQRSSGAVEEAASLWVVRGERGLTASEQDEFLQWLAADPGHGRELGRQRRNWDRLRLLADWRPEHSPCPNRDLLAPPMRRVRRWIGAGRRRLAPLALAAAAAVGWGAFLATPTVPLPPAAVAAAAIPMIEQRILPDGTRIDLNRGAAISVFYSGRERRVRLEEGEAHFNVVSDAARPFIVSAAGVDVRAVGTAFNVRLEAKRVEVLVTEGRIDMKAPEPAALHPVAGDPVPEVARLQAGQRALVALGRPDSRPEVFAISAGEIAARLAWQPQRLEFNDAPLSAIVAEFNRRNAPLEIVLAHAGLATLEITASLRSDNVEGFLRLLEAGFPVKVERSGRTVIIRSAAARR
jgi:transmembrane sensor